MLPQKSHMLQKLPNLVFKERNYLASYNSEFRCKVIQDNGGIPTYVVVWTLEHNYMFWCYVQYHEIILLPCRRQKKGKVIVTYFLLEPELVKLKLNR